MLRSAHAEDVRTILRQKHGRQEIDLGVYHHYIYIFGFYVSAPHCLEVLGLTQVVEREVHRVVDMPERVGIVEPQLLCGCRLAPFFYLSFCLLFK